jgi:hypothetical protein
LDSTYADIKFSTNYGYQRISEAAGSVVSALDKLNFGTGIAQGIDGYQYSTGLIGEAARTIYGDASDPATYPGIIASDNKVDLAGALLRRLQFSLLVRVVSGANKAVILNAIKSAVAAVVNSTLVGQSISFSSIIKTVQKVGGVRSVTMISPTYNSANDLVNVQPYEKPRILNLDTDVLVTFLGD